MDKNKENERVKINASKRPHILLVEDEEAIRMMLQTKLYKDGYNVTVAANGLHAMQIMKTGQNFSLIICDLKMPGKDGLQLYQAMRELNIKTPLVLITGFPEKHKIIEAIRHGVRDVLLKPIKHQDLMDKIRTYIKVDDGDSESVEDLKNVA